MTTDNAGLTPGFQRLFAFFFVFQLVIAGVIIAVYVGSDADAQIREQMPQIAFSLMALMYFAITLVAAELPARIPVLKAHGFEADRFARTMFRWTALAWLVLALGNALFVQFA
jgi:hypothetical protein